MNNEFANTAKQYKRTWAGTFMLVEGAKLMEKIGGEDLFATRKMDGIMQVVFVRDGAVSAYTSHGKEIPTRLPCFVELSQTLAAAGIRNVTLGAELYATIREEGRERVCDVKTAVADPALRGHLHLAPFDILDLEGEAFQADHYKEKWSWLNRMFGQGTLVRRVDGRSAAGKGEVKQIYDEWVVEGGSEGLVVHCESSMICKVKPRHSVDAVIIGYTEGEAEHAGMVRDMLLAVMRPDGVLQQFAATGTGLTEEDRAGLFQRLEGMRSESEYIETDSRNVAFRMVRPELVVEMSGLDFVTENAAGEAKQNMLLSYSDADGYNALGQTPGCAVHSPVFVRFRDDKGCNESDIRLSQLTDLCSFQVKAVAGRDSLERSRKLIRRIFVKESGGKRMLQKYLVWKTNKESAGDFPAYVLHYTDYSPSRLESLKRDIRVSDSEEQILELCQQMIDTNVKKGWNEIC